MVAEQDHPGVVAGPAKARADALRELLDDPDIGMVMFSVGGYNANDLLDHMAGWGSVPRKPLVGYSDSTAILHAYQQLTGSIVFYGPAAMPQFGEWPTPFRESVRGLVDTIVDGEPREREWPGWYTQATFDWTTEDQVARGPFGASQPTVIRPGTGRGTLIGGNVPTLNLLAGTRWLPRPDGPTVLAVEGTASEGRPEALRRWLQHLRSAGALDTVTAVLIGRVPHDSDHPRRMDDLGALVGELFPGVPIVADLPFGHTDPIITLPLGAEVEVQADERCRVATLVPTTTTPALEPMR